MFWSLLIASTLWAFVDDVLFPKWEFGVAAAPSRYLFCDECAESFWIFGDACLYPSHQTESKWADETIPFLWKNFLAVNWPQNSSSLDLKEPVNSPPPTEIYICSFRKSLLIHLPVQWAAMRAFFARLSTLMLIRSCSKQSRHLFVSLACACTYLYHMGNGWVATWFLKTRRISPWTWLVGNGRRCSFLWETTPLSSQSTSTRGIASWHLDAAAFSINCVIRPPISWSWVAWAKLPLCMIGRPFLGNILHGKNQQMPIVWPTCTYIVLC